ncbi:hypothetical protein [Falsiroseomonas bella]|uniref:hypothetical protein n=1 Tax=Falsiroseomonas bella TaxID=2184016 RepID=UPI0013049E2A|nr:hypothetical protein [Falsiroseomonas bella]
MQNSQHIWLPGLSMKRIARAFMTLIAVVGAAIFFVVFYMASPPMSYWRTFEVDKYPEMLVGKTISDARGHLDAAGYRCPSPSNPRYPVPSSSSQNYPANTFIIYCRRHDWTRPFAGIEVAFNIIYTGDDVVIKTERQIVDIHAGQ